jgi:hypothetical protein
MERCSIDSLSIRDIAGLLAVWHRYRESIYQKLTVPEFVEGCYTAAHQGWLYVARNAGTITAFCIAYPKEGSIYCECWAGETKHCWPLLERYFREYSTLTYHKAGKLYKVTLWD